MLDCNLATWYRVNLMKKPRPSLPAHEVTILEHLIGPGRGNLPKSLARYILTLKFRPVEIDRINVLSAKAREGTLSQRESDQLDSYLRIGNLVSMMKSKARRSLKEPPPAR